MNGKHFLFIAAIMVLASCNSKEQSSESNDGVAVDTPVVDHTKLKTDSVEAQINAQDSLFEDGSIPSSWHNAGFDNPVAFKHFIVTLQDWVKTDNVDSIAAHIDFPLGKIKADAFKNQYAQLFNQKVKGTVISQRLDRIFRNGQGAMLGNGELWIRPKGNDYRIYGINN